MLDFIGREIKEGDFMAAGGSGNGAAEYGMILYQVLEVGEKLKLVRLTSHYPTHSASNTVIKPRKITAKNPNKYVVVKPSAKVKRLFKRALAGKLTSDDSAFIGRWIHGSTHQGQVFA
jgi:hypothetical protein